MDSCRHPHASEPDDAPRRLRGRSRRCALSQAIEPLEPRTLLAVELLKDVNPTTTVVGSPAQLAELNGNVYFNGSLKLWRSDGTPAGTTPVHPHGFQPQEIARVGNFIYFSSGGQLFRSDGTEAGTTPVHPTFMSPRDIADVNGRAFFRGNGGDGDELWTSDGTQTGTFRVKDIRPGSAGSNPRGFTHVNGRLFFRADDGANGLELWTSDGTSDGTQMVRDIAPGAASSGPTSLVNVGGTLYFTASDGSTGFELWRSDGTEAGTTPVTDLRPGAGGSTPVWLTDVGGTLMFVANDGVTGFEIWRSDGTAGGTTIVRDLVRGAGGALIDNLAAVGSTLYFTADDGTSGVELWKTDGTSGGTTRVKDIIPGAGSSHPHTLHAFGQKLFFVATDGAAGHEPWVSDGTAAGTFLLQDIAPGGHRSSAIYVTPTTGGATGNRVFFVADNFAGNALFVTDGSAPGTSFVKRPSDVFVNPSNIRHGINVGGVAYFNADDGVHGQELWRSDGTPTGTYMVKDLTPGPHYPSFDRFTDLNGTLLFQLSGQWWRSDGTDTGTFKLSDASVRAATAPVVIGGSLYFAASGTAGTGLWKTNGSVAGTTFVKSFGASQFWWPQHLTNVNGTLLFAAESAATGYELWRSDGTPGGTVIVKDILPGPISSGLELLTAAGSRLYFRANGDNGAGYELWTSDGSEGGTVMLKDVRPGADGSNIWSMTAVGAALFFSADDGIHGQELWRSDGTANGTALLKDIRAGHKGSSLGSFAAAHGHLWFRADDGAAGDELWKSDGTPAGTVLVKDITAGAAGSALGRIMPLPGGRVLFAGNNYQGWLSDGTPGGTFAYFWQYAESPVVVGNNLLFSASSEWGNELLKVNLDTVTPYFDSAADAGGPSKAAPAVTARPPAGAALDSPVGADVFYDATGGSEKPDASAFGFGPLNAAYQGAAQASPFDSDIPDEAKLRRLAVTAAASGKPLALNVEHYGIDLRYYPEGTVALGLEKHGAMLDWMHDEAPTVRVGQTGSFPNGTWPAPTPGSAGEAVWQAANDRIRTVAQKMDILFGGIYELSANVKDWVDFAHAQMAEARRFGDQPRYPFIWPVYDGSFDVNVYRRPVSAEFWRLELDVVSALAEGAVVWGDYGRFDEDMPWYTVMRDFTQHPDPLPAPAATQLAATGSAANVRINLTWKDNAYTETGYRVERRAAGEVSFMTIATLAADVTAYADTSALTQTDYTYRVIAINAAGDAFASNEAAGKILLAPAAPTGVAASPLNARRIRVSWTPPPPAHDVTGFVVERDGVAIDTVGADVAAFEDAGLQPGSDYAYRVRAVNAAGASPWSSGAAATTPFSDTALRAYYRFDSATGTAASDSGPAGLHAALVNGPSWTSGTLGGALAFDGVDDRVVVPDSSDLRFAAADSFTVAAWVNLASLPNQTTAVLAKARGAAAGWYAIGLDSTHHWTFDGAGGVLASADIATTGWTHVMAVQDGAGGTRKLYVNGVLVASGAAQAADAAGALWIGAAETVNQFFAGRIDDVRLYARVISAADAAAYASPRVNLPGGAGADTWTVRLDATGEAYAFFVNAPVTAAPTFTRPRDAVASIDVTAGDGADRLVLDFANGRPLPDYGFTFDGGAGAADTLVVRGANAGDVFTLNATQLGHGGSAIDYTNAEALELFTGTYTLTADVNGRSLRAGAGATAIFDATQRLAMLQVDPGGLVDLRGNEIVLDYSSVSPIGVWTGTAYDGIAGLLKTGRVVSTSGAGPGNAVAAFGVAEARDALNLAPAQTATWSGRSVDATSVLVKFTYAGDANLDGKINIDDYGQIDSMISKAGSVFGWFNGDFNYDGKINIDDYGLIDGNVNAQGLPM